MTRSILPAGLVLGLALAMAAPALAKPGGGGMADRLAAMDANGDGQITRAEAVAMRQTMFARIDADKNGYLTEAEMKAAREAAAAQRKAGKGGDGEGIRGMSRLDVNGDGQIAKSELEAAPFPLFERFDSNKDGVLQKAEWPQGRGKS